MMEFGGHTVYLNVNISQGCQDRQPYILGTAAWALSWPCLLTPLDYYLPPAAQWFFPATAWLEVGSVFIQTEGRMPGAKSTHTASWSASVFLGVFPSQPSPNLAVLFIKSDKISAWGGRIAGKRFPSMPHLTRSGTGCAKPQKTPPLVLWECKQHQHTRPLSPVPQSPSKTAGQCRCLLHFTHFTALKGF